MRVVRSYIFSSPIHALAGLIRCRSCGAWIVEMKGGNFGCNSASKGDCSNQLRISRDDVEAIILSDLEEKFLKFERPEKLAPTEAWVVKNCPYYVEHTSIQAVALLNAL